MSIKNKALPGLGGKILALLTPEPERKYLLGDHEEIYNDLHKAKNGVYAYFWFWFQVTKALMEFINNTLLKDIAMFINYLKTAIRNFRKHKGFSFINIFGLAIGMSVCLFIIKFVLFFYSFDDFHENSDRIFMVNTIRLSSSGSELRSATTSFPLVEVLRNECPGVEKAAVLAHCANSSVSFNNKTLSAEFEYADHGFFEVFKTLSKFGESSDFLKQPNRIVITEKTAEKFFGNENPMGKVMHCGELGDMTIDGVIYDIPYNSQFHEIEIFASLSTLEDNWRNDKNKPLENWRRLVNPSPHLYILLRDDDSNENVETFLSGIAEKRMNYDRATYSFNIIPAGEYVFGTDLYYNSYGLKFWHIMLVLWIISALSILMIASFNYSNMSTAKALTRMREIGIRKVMGAQRIHLLLQFVGETILLTLIALSLAIFFHYIIIDLFFRLHPVLSTIFVFEDTISIYIVFLVFALLTGIVSGFIPALYISRPRPIEILSNFSKNGVFSRSNIRRVLITAQLALSFFFIMVTIASYKHYKYADNFDLGFNIDNVINVKIKPFQYRQLRNAFSGSSYVSGISASQYIPGTTSYNNHMVKRVDSIDSLRVSYLPVDENFIDNMEMKIVAGQNYPEKISPRDQRLILINETAVKLLGFNNPGDAIGEGIVSGRRAFTIIGVVNDYTTYAYYRQMEPGIVGYRPGLLYYANIRLSGNDNQAAIEYLEKKWSELYPNTLFDYEFYSDHIERNSTITSKLSFQIGSFVTFLAIIIASLGLLGITMYNVQTKIKEIGIRKTLGASVNNIISLLSKDYLILIGISFVLITPLTIYLHDLALKSLVNKSELGIIDFGIGILVMLAVGGITILSQLIKAVHVNPADTLRYE
ncbi:MAG: FtsX-like permease family protein [bacterium]|nr:FtsX-like permease family protein [bacterium]